MGGRYWGWGALPSLNFPENAWVRGLLIQPHPAPSSEPETPGRGNSRYPHFPIPLLQVLPQLYQPTIHPIRLPHSRPFHSSGMCLKPSFTTGGVGTRNPCPIRLNSVIPLTISLLPSPPFSSLFHRHTLNNFWWCFNIYGKRFAGSTLLAPTSRAGVGPAHRMGDTWASSCDLPPAPS